jgi:hypothetical protein
MAGLVNILKLVHKMSDHCNFILMYLIIHTAIYIYFIDVKQLPADDQDRSKQILYKNIILTLVHLSML